MKIILAISDSFCANFIKGQGKFLVDNGHEVIIISGPGNEIDKLEKDEPVRVIRLPFAREISPLSDLKNLIKIIQIISKEKPDIINAGNPKTGFLFSLASILFWKIPLIFTLRGVRSDTLVGIKKKIIKLTEKLTCGLANTVITISPSLKDHAVRIGLVASEKCIVLGKGSSNGININHYIKSKNIEEQSNLLRHTLNIPTSSFILTFVGRVTKDKGIIEVLKAFQLCLTANRDIHLVIGGPIELQDPIPNKYYSLIEDHPRIHYLGKQIDVRPIYGLSNALVLYSYREGFGNVVIEASSMEVPTIVADIPGLRDTTENNVTGLIVEPQNPKILCEAILKLYDDRNLALKLGQQGRVRVVNYFSNEIIWSQQNKLYLKLCKSS